MAPSIEEGEIDVGPKYEWIRPLGKGAYGVAVLMRDRLTSDQVAVKFIQRGEMVDKNVEREIQNHRRLSSHSNVVKFREVFLTSTHLGIAMDYASGGTLFDQVIKKTRFREDIARYFFQQLVCGVTWCHSRGVCHRDLKLENTLLDGRSLPRVLICDFGYSKSRDLDSKPKTTVGTPAYVAPEVLSRGTYDGEKADVWSCGVALYTMLVGGYPFQDPDHPGSCPRTVQRIMAVQYSIPVQLQLSDSCVDLIRRIFVSDPELRISLPEIREHPWYLANLLRECQIASGSHTCVPPTQTEAEIAAIIQAARTAGEQYGCNATGGGSGSKGSGLSEQIRLEEAMVDLMDEEDYLE